MTAPHRPRRAALAAVLLLALSPAARAAGPKTGVESLLTPEAVGFLHVRVADVWDSPSFAYYRKILATLGADELRGFDAKFAPSPSQIEGVTIIMPSMDVRAPIPDGRPVGESMVWVITTKRPLPRADLMRALGPDVRTKAYRGTDYLFDEARWAGLVPLDETTLLIASEDAVIRVLDQQARARGAEGRLAKVFAAEGSKHALLLAANPAVMATKNFLREIPPEAVPLTKATAAWAALDLKQENRLAGAIEFATEAQAADGKKAAEAVRKLFLELIAKGMKEVKAEEVRAAKRPLMGPLDLPENFSPVVLKALLTYVESNLKALAVESRGTELRASINLSELFPANGDVLAVLAVAGLAEFRSSVAYSTYRGYDRGEEIPYHVRDQFERISAALQAYHADKGNFPPAAVYDKDGKPLLSWRVLILPYLEQGRFEGGPGMKGGPPPFNPNPNPPQRRTYADLYKQFKLDEPWDSLHNKRLLERMPTAYRIEFTANNWRQRSDWKTGVQVFTGPGTLFPGPKAVSRGQVRDGAETTIAVAFRDDATAAVAWTKPADMPYGAKRPLPKLLNFPPEFRGPKDPGGQAVFAIMADGQARRFPVDYDEKMFRGLITIDGGESVKLPEPRKDPFPPKFNGPPFPIDKN